MKAIIHMKYKEKEKFSKAVHATVIKKLWLLAFHSLFIGKFFFIMFSIWHFFPFWLALKYQRNAFYNWDFHWLKFSCVHVDCLWWEISLLWCCARLWSVGRAFGIENEVEMRWWQLIFDGRTWRGRWKAFCWHKFC